MRIAFFALGLLACVQPRQAGEIEVAPPPGEIWNDDAPVRRCTSRLVAGARTSCGFAAREVRVWGSAPREGPSGSPCPLRVLPKPEGLIVEALAGYGSMFDPLPTETCIPEQYLTGSRHVIAVEDGWVVGYEGPFGGETFFVNHDGSEKKPIFRGRALGFARAPSHDVLALVAGRAHLGRGAILRLDRNASFRARIVAVLPIEPAGVAFDDGGAILGYGERFLFRAHEDGRIENVHYLAREIGNVFSIARAADGGFYLGLDCGVLRLVPNANAHDELWWSARDGASGRWSICM